MLLLAILTQIVALFTTLTTLVFLMAGGANSTPKQIRELKRMLWGVFLAGLIGLIGCIYMITRAHPGYACLFGLLPIVVCVGLITWMFVTEYPKREPSKHDDGW